MTQHEKFMQRCIELAKTAAYYGESPVGAILVKDRKIVAEGMEAVKNRRDVTCHAEIEAIRHFRGKDSATNLSGCILYTTHEPCLMCSYVIRHHKIGTVVWGIAPDETGGHSSAYDILQDTTIKKWGQPPKLITGVCETACMALLR